MKLGARIFGILGGLLCLYLLVGLLLPGKWTARQEAVLPHTAAEIFPFMNRVEQWPEWMPMPESGTEVTGPPQGAGAGLRWDDTRYGRGWLQITESRSDSKVSYTVDVEEGALRIQGVLSLKPDGSGTRLSWEESGDFGWNPLLGYAARGMGRSQGEAMRASLEKLALILAGNG